MKLYDFAVSSLNNVKDKTLFILFYQLISLPLTKAIIHYH